MTILHAPLFHLHMNNKNKKTRRRGRLAHYILGVIYSRLSAAFGCPVPDAVKKGERKIAGG